tara:strand:- start:557 stop:2206 length:1650 start_codon:yes stop_codon:yes gene_type:complete
MRCIAVIFLSFFLVGSINSQNFSRKDSLRGNLTSLRTCYDVIFYDLILTLDEKNKSIINSSNSIHFQAKENFNKIQIDLAQNMQINKIEFLSQALKFERDFDAVYIYFPKQIQKNEVHKIKVFYEGNPKIAKNPPWDGGFSWKHDKNNNPWISVSCQGTGASTWWPCKDHQSDEPDSMQITGVVRSSLQFISNGNLRNQHEYFSEVLNSNVIESCWFVSYPINNYNVTLYIGDYIQFSDTYVKNKDTLMLDYYVLKNNLIKAKNHFKQVKPMLRCFENYFGKYPYWNDGYALVEAPYLGMEHQSAIAYGNNYLPGYRGNISYIDSLKFDFIILHETGHEWWGNSITTNDIADMWVHEGFCTYAEVLYVECMYGYDKMLSYVNNQKKHVKNDRPIIGKYNLNFKGSSDMYSKGSLMLHTLRNVINNDTSWFKLIKDISIDFRDKNIDGAEIIQYINDRTELDLNKFFQQYLNFRQIPTFQYKLQKHGAHYTLLYKWKAIGGFNMPIKINYGTKNKILYPTSLWQELDLGYFDIETFNVRDDLFFIRVNKM